MPPKGNPVEQEFVIQNEFDVVIIRQEVRQRARLIGMDLRQQARLTAVVSSIAREFMSLSCGLVITITSQVEGRAALDLACALPFNQSRPDQFVLERIITEARMLVDELVVGDDSSQPILHLRINR